MIYLIVKLNDIFITFHLSAIYEVHNICMYVCMCTIIFFIICKLKFLLTLRQTGDIMVGTEHPKHGYEAWAQQSQGCGRQGEFMYVPYDILLPNTSLNVGHVVADTWLKFRYGIFKVTSWKVMSFASFFRADISSK